MAARAAPPSRSLIAALVVGFSAAVAAAETPNPFAPKPDEAADTETSQEDEREKAQKALCELIETAATDHELPLGFFTRLLWKESRFRSDAVSPKGAQGIAQFMPGTAAERGLADPFDPRTAIPASASFLSDLRARFGNLGLAAAAYNAGPERVASWLAEEASLPWETEDFVLTITGVPAGSWISPDPDAGTPGEADDGKDCLALAALLRTPGAGLAPEIETATAPWGVQVAGNFSRARAVAAYVAIQDRYPSLMSDRAPMIVSGRMRGRGTRAFYQMRVPMQTREEAERFCADLRAAGGSCVVLKT